MHRRHHLHVLALLIAALVLTLHNGAAQTGALLIAAEIQPRETQPQQIGTERSRTVFVNFNAVRTTSDEITLNLFDDLTYTAVKQRIEPRMAGQTGYIWFGTLKEVPYSNVILVVGDDLVNGRILLPGRNYYIAPTSTAGLHTVSDINTFAQRPTPDQDDAVINETMIEPPSARATSDDGSVIDVMVVYTPAAAAFAGGEANMIASIEGTVALANVTYENSLINFRLRLVHTAQVDYTEISDPYDIGINLDNLTYDNDGYMDIVHEWRDQYAADLVTLITGTPVAQRAYCGIAQLPGQFNVVEALCISDITYAHELGHNMGSAHDRANASYARRYYAYGYQDPSEGAQDWADFVTVMAYNVKGHCPEVYQEGVCPTIAYWSNPNQTYNGKPLGYPDTDPDLHRYTATNNTRSLNEMAWTVANYRVSQDGGTATVTPVPTLTYTPYAPTPYPVTPTPASGSQLLLNTGFEIDGDNDRVPDGWVGKSLTEDFRLCRNAYRGSCVFRVKGSTGERSRLIQSVYGQHAFNIGDTLTLSAYVRSTTIQPGAQLELIVNYASSLPADKVVIPITPNLAAYTLLSGSVTLQGEVTGVRVIVRYNNNSATGSFLIDNITLRWKAP